MPRLAQRDGATRRPRRHNRARVHGQRRGWLFLDDPATIYNMKVRVIARRRVAAADIVVAMKPGLDIPQITGVRYETWTLPDPKGWDVNSIRPVRDDIRDPVIGLLSD